MNAEVEDFRVYGDAALPVDPAESLPRRIWMFSPDEYHRSSDLILKCIHLCRGFNSSWGFRIVRPRDFIAGELLPVAVKDWLQWPVTLKIEWMRLWYLYNLGGVAVDCRCFCLCAFDDWLNEHVEKTGFFAFAGDGIPATPSRCLMASVPGNVFIGSVLNAYRTYVTTGKGLSPGDRVRRLFRNKTGNREDGRNILDRLIRKEVESDSPAARVWAKTPRIPVSEVEFLRNEGFHAQASERTRQFLDHLSVPLIRMDKSCDQLPAKSGTNLTLLLNKNIAPETINPLSGSGGDLSPNPWRQVLVVGSVRTGTTVFRKFLASSSLYTDFNETFHPHLHGSRNWFFWLTRLGPVHPMEYHQLWPRFLRQSKFDPEIALVDVKTEAIHLLRDQNLNRAWPPFLMCDPKIETVLIRMKRRNVLSQVLSYEKLLKTGQAIATESGVPKAGVWLDPGTVLQKIEDYQRREFEVDKLIGKANLYLDYEDLFDEQGMFSSEVIQKCKDLFPETQVDFDANPNFRKMGKPTDLQNREEISEVLRNTPYAWMLEQF